MLERSLRRNKAALLGLPALLLGCAVIAGVAGALNGFSHPAPFVFLCFLAAAALLLAGLATLTGFSHVLASRRVELALGAVYTSLGLLSLLVGLVFFGLMNSCWICL